MSGAIIATSSRGGLADGRTSAPIRSSARAMTRLPMLCATRCTVITGDVLLSRTRKILQRLSAQVRVALIRSYSPEAPAIPVTAS